MKKIVIMCIVLTAVLASAISCTKTPTAPQATATATSTPTATNTATPVYGTISGNLQLPTGQPQNGVTWQVIVDDDLDHTNGIVRMVLGVCGPSVTVPYSVTAVAGTYFVYAVVKVNSGLTYPPSQGDYVGVSGATWPAFPIVQGVNVVSNQTNSGVNIAMTLAANNVSGTLTLPANAEGKNYLIMMDNDGDGSNGGVDFLEINAISGSSGTTYGYGALVLFPGTWYIVAQVDVNNSGLPGNPSGGDYAGITGPHTMDSTLSNGPYNITLNTIP